MSREVIVLRHCKSDWNNTIHQDEQRPLSQRGLSNATAIGGWMNKQSMRPDIVLCSTAVRAQQTLELVNEELNLPVDTIQYHKDLYLASLPTLLKYLSDVDISIHSVMMIGHNPGLDYLVDYISHTKPPLTSNGKLMTTGCIAHFECPDDWQNLKHHGNLLSITRPSDITGHNEIKE